jgi:uncharacterized membrane protein YidH (DUF202 family)
MNLLGRVIKQINTGDDNQTFEPSYIITNVAVVVGLVLEFHAVWYQKTFDFQSYGVGIGAMVAAMEAAKRIGKWGTQTSSITTSTTTTGDGK